MSYSYEQEVAQETEKVKEAWVAEWKGFSFPPFCSPPDDLWDYTVFEYKRTIRSVHQSVPLLKSEWYSIVTVLHSFIGWLHTRDGSDWLFRLFGIEEVEMHHGYRYYYDRSHPITKGSGASLRIFIRHSIKRFGETAYDEHGAVSEMKRLMRKAYADENKNPKFASDSMWKWVLTVARNWFTEPVDKHVPYEKVDRIGGLQWAQNYKDPWSPNDTMWSAITETQKYRPRAYRVEQNGGVIWTSRQKITSEPLDKALYGDGVAAISKGLVSFGEGELIKKIQADFRCNSCDRIVCCTTKGREGEQLCDYCFGTQVETGTRETLDNCTYTECYQCPNHMRDSDDLKNLKVRIGSSYNEWPIRR